MALSEQFFYDIIHEIMGENIGHHAKKMIAKQCKISHDADCDFVGERAFKAGQEQIWAQYSDDFGNPIFKYPTYQNYKDSL